MEEAIMVSVIMTSFNHAKYVCQAVDSVLSQTTNFRYEVLIGDDASTDGTGELLLSKYGRNNKVRLFLRRQNIGGCRNGYDLFVHARGRYICVCECDDYWTDENYLQMMADWLEAHTEYAAVAARRIILSEKTNHKTLVVPSKDCNCDITLHDFLNGYKTFDLCACLYVNFFHDGENDYRIYKASNKVGDLTTAIHLLHHGKLFQLENIIGVYRTDRIKGTTNYNSITSRQDMFLDHMRIIKYLKKCCYSELDYSYWEKSYALSYMTSAKPGIEKIRVLLLIARQVEPKVFCRLLIEDFGDFIFNLKK